MRWKRAGRGKRKATSGKGRWRRSGGISPREQCAISPDDRYRRGSQWWLSCYTSNCKAVEMQGEKKGWGDGEGFLMLDFIFLIGEEIAHVPQSRDALTRGLLTQRSLRNAEGYWVDGGRVLSEATSEMSPLPRFDSAGAGHGRAYAGIERGDLGDVAAT